MPGGAFQKPDLTPENRAQFIRNELRELREAQEAATGAGNDLSVKEIEKKIARAENNLNKTLDQNYDPGISFEDTGIDYLCIDERSEEHTSELQSRGHLVCRLLLEKKKLTNLPKSNHNVQPTH